MVGENAFLEKTCRPLGAIYIDKKIVIINNNPHHHNKKRNNNTKEKESVGIVQNFKRITTRIKQKIKRNNDFAKEVHELKSLF